MPAEAPEFEIDDAIVLILGAPSETTHARNRLEGITRLEKLIFLLERETSVASSMTESGEFDSHNFGPFSKKVYQAVETLASAGLVADSDSLAETTEDSWETQDAIGVVRADPYTSRNFALTERGRRYYEALISELPTGTEDELARFKAQFALIPLRQLVRYVYQKYPDYTDKSLIRDDILGH